MKTICGDSIAYYIGAATMVNKYILVSPGVKNTSNKLWWAHILGAVAQLALVIVVSIAINNSSTDEIIARSTVITVYDKPRFPDRVREYDLFGTDRRLKPDKTIDSLVTSLENRGAPCTHVACCADHGGNIRDIPHDLLISDCFDETDHRWSDPLSVHLNPPGYNVLILVLLAPIISFIHHAYAILFRRGPSVVAKYIDYSLSASFVLMVLYQMARIYSFETQIIGFFCCALSMWFAYSYETTTEIFYFGMGVLIHLMAWLPFFINLGQLMAHTSTLDVQTVDNDPTTESSSTSSSASNVGIGLAVGGTLAAYIVYPIITYICINTSLLEQDNLHFIHTSLSVVAKTLLVAGALIAVRFT